MQLSRAMELVEFWKKKIPAEPENQTPMEQVILALSLELKVDRILELHKRVQLAESEVKRLNQILDILRKDLKES